MTIEEAIAQLEIDIKRLKVHYDMFFAGTQPRQPYELRKQVDQMIRALNNTSIRKYQHRFMLNTLIGRYNTLCELWAKQMRAQEESGRAAAIAAILERSHPAPPRRANREEVCYSVRVSDPAAEQDAMKTLYDEYLRARHLEGGSAAIKLESFVGQIARQAASLKETSGCHTIEFRILRRGDAVTLKARVAK